MQQDLVVGSFRTRTFVQVLLTVRSVRTSGFVHAVYHSCYPYPEAVEPAFICA